MLESIKNHIIIWRIYFGQKTGTEARQKARRFFRRLFGLLIIVAAAYWVVFYVLPNRQHIDVDWKAQAHPIFVKGEHTGYSASGTGDSMLLPLPLLQEYVDPSIRYEEDQIGHFING